MVKDREVKLGKTIPVINIDLLKLPSMGESRKVSNDKAGVSSVSYIYEGEEVMGVPKGIIDQLNYTLVDSIDRPGDTFSYYKWIKEDDIKYGIEKLKIDTAQEDGTLDKKKLASFIKGIDERLRALRSDFKSIKRTFFWGETPAASGIQLLSVKNYSVKPEDDIIEHQYVEKETIAISLVQSATQTAASSSVAKVEDTKKSLTDKIDKTSTTLQKQLEQEQVKDSIQQQQIRNDLQAQITANDAYYREKYGSPTK
jgi:hypothetical protein